MSEKRPEALRLADILDKVGGQFPVEAKAAKELRRLHEVDVELLDALTVLFDDYKMLADSGDAGNWRLEDQEAGKQALAAIAKATKGQE